MVSQLLRAISFRAINKQAHRNLQHRQRILDNQFNGKHPQHMFLLRCQLHKPQVMASTRCLKNLRCQDHQAHIPFRHLDFRARITTLRMFRIKHTLMLIAMAQAIMAICQTCLRQINNTYHHIQLLPNIVRLIHLCITLRMEHPHPGLMGRNIFQVTTFEEIP